MFETLLADIRYAFRWLAKSPAFTLLAVASFAIGIGFNTALFTLVDALLFLRRTHPLPVEKRPEFVPVNMSDVVREAARDLLTRSPQRTADVRIEAEDEVLATGHATLLAAAVRNLLANALKFTEPGQAVEIVVRRQGSECLVLVDDAGRGIAPADRARVFDPFFRDSQARASHQGFGLGLAILRRVVRAHGGEASVGESPLGGARFELRVPEWSPSE